MKFISFRAKNSNAPARLGVVTDSGVIDLTAAQAHVPADLGDALAKGIDLHAAAKAAVQSKAACIPMAQIDTALPVARPGKIICLGLNYVDHAKEGGRDKPTYPWFFTRCTTSLMADGEAAIRPRVSTMFDYEAELAVIIGKKCRHLTSANALDVVFGYTCFNDVSVRDYQRKTPQFTIGKNFDATGGFGPLVVTADELKPGAKGLRIQSRLNGQVMQDANTSDMIFDVAETLVILTECMTLEPGDLIVMGTPAGVGMARTPPVWMKHGDVIDVEIENIGVLSNPIRDEA